VFRGEKDLQANSLKDLKRTRKFTKENNSASLRGGEKGGGMVGFQNIRKKKERRCEEAAVREGKGETQLVVKRGSRNNKYLSVSRLKEGKGPWLLKWGIACVIDRIEGRGGGNRFSRW